MAKDKKYGFGGPKHLSKQNDKKSLNDFSSFNPKRGKATGGKKVRFNMVFQRPSFTKLHANPHLRDPLSLQGKGPNRPGKTARVKARLNKKK
jgi:hypothetical protein